MAKMRLLIIGGTGVLSSAVVTESIRQGIEVTIINRGKKKFQIPNGVTLIKADYRDSSLIRQRLHGQHFDAVIDFICYNKADIDYSISLLHSIADQYVFISTTCVYNTRIPGVKDEDSEKVLEEWSYSVNKWECECYLREQADRLHFNYTIIRPCITYDNTRIPYGIMPPYGYHWTLCARILAGKPVLRWNKGTTRWNMMRVEDFAVGVVGIVGRIKAYGEAYNISGDNAYSWNDVLNAVGKSIGCEPIVLDLNSEDFQDYYPERKGEIAGRSYDSIVSNAKIKALVPQFETKYGLEGGVSMTVDAYRKENYQRGIDWHFDANTDRIIKKWCKKNGIDAKKYKIGFIDYLGNARVADKILYWKIFYRDTLFLKVVRRLKTCFRN